MGLSLMLVLILVAAAVAPIRRMARAQEPVTIRAGLLPILDVLPFFVAEEAGYFEEAGIKVESVPVSSSLERDQLTAAGQIDAMLNDVISTGIFNQDQVRIQIVAKARRAYEGAPEYRILAAPRSNITLPSEAANFEIGMSENTVIHYIAQRMMEQEGISAADLKWQSVPSIPARYQLLMEGQLKVACLPDPLAQAALAGGAILITDDTALIDTGFSQSVLSFRAEFIEDHPEAVQAFLSAWMRAADDINADPEAYRDLWMEKTTVPDSVKDTYVLPPFPTYTITTESEWDDVVAWLTDLGIAENVASYEDSVNPTFLDAIRPASAAGDPANGEALFASLGCNICHAVDSDAVIVGPSLMGIGEEAAEEHADMGAESYLRQSIVDPGAMVDEDFQNVMQPYDTLSESDLNDLVAYLLTLK
jgi:NitT/TauT family transport system substrate-binding protein